MPPLSTHDNGARGAITQIGKNIALVRRQGVDGSQEMPAAILMRLGRERGA